MNRTVRYIIFIIIVANIVLVLLCMMPKTKRVMQQSNAVIVIDAGHGGFDGGATGRITKVKEDGLNLAVAKKLQELCAQSGYTVVMTRENENALGSTKHDDMRMRKNIIEESCADVVISIHMNKYGDAAVLGPQVFYYHSSEDGQMLASCIQDKLNTQLMPQRMRAHKPEDYFILRTGGAPCVIVECGFLSNEREERLLQTDEYQQKCAEAIMTGLLQYLNQRNVSDPYAQIHQ